MKFILKIFNILIVILIMINLFYSSKVIDYGAEMRQLSQEITLLENQNNQLEIQLAEQTSFKNIMREIKQQGFISPQQVVGIPASPVAQR